MLELWQRSYGGSLLIMLPDTFGTTQFLEDAPAWVLDWTGQRVDSKPPMEAGDEYIDWIERRGGDPKTKRLIASDGLDVDDILTLHRYFEGRIRFSAGWGTLLTNDFRGCHPRGEATLEPLSLVCKLTSVGGRPTVKLSDNANKRWGQRMRWSGIGGCSGLWGWGGRLCWSRPSQGECQALRGWRS